METLNLFNNKHVIVSDRRCVYCHRWSTNTNKLVRNELNFTRLRNICAVSLALNSSMIDLLRFWMCSSLSLSLSQFIHNFWWFRAHLVHKSAPSMDSMLVLFRIDKHNFEMFWPPARMCKFPIYHENCSNVSTRILQRRHCVRLIVWTRMRPFMAHRWTYTMIDTRRNSNAGFFHFASLLS